MLRKLLIGFFAAVFLIGLTALFTGERGVGPFTGWAGLMLVAVLVENWRYRHRSGRGERLDDGEWQLTEERFVDPESGAVMRVYYHPGTGERRYEAEGGSA
jgi:hypothetical protein